MQQQIVRSYWTLALALILGLGLMLGLTTWAGAQDGTLPSSAEAVSGTTIAVDTAVDELANNGKCSLREALRAANTDLAVDSCPAGSGWDTITLPGTTFQLTRGGVGEDNGLTGDLDVRESVNIVGAGAAATIIDGNALDRVFHVDPAGLGAVLDLRRVTVTGGVSDAGGGLRAAGGLTIIRASVFQENWATDSGGGIRLDVGTLRLIDTIVQTNTMGVDGEGGGLYVANGALTLEGSTIYSNTARYGGGLYAQGGSVILRDTGVISNIASGSGADGGGIYAGAANIIVEEGSEIAYNRADDNGGGIHSAGGSILAVADSRLHHNWCADAGGGGWVSDSATTILRSTVEHNHAEDYGGAFYSSGDLVFVDSTIGHNSSVEGGAVFMNRDGLVISNTTVFSNTASEVGGAVYLYGDGVYVQNSLFEENTAAQQGGAIYIYNGGGMILRDSAFRKNRAEDGGAIELYEEASLFADRSTFAGNVASLRGGAIHSSDSGTSDLRNCTFSHNEADSGGAIYHKDGAVAIEWTTIANNKAQDQGGGIVVEAPFAAQNSIIAGNSAEGSPTGASDDCVVTAKFFSGGNNVLGAGTGCAPTRYDQTVPPAQVFTALLQALADNGGALLPDASHPGTHALRSGGSAVDAGNEIFWAGVDQRGTIRPQGNACDVGAYESDASATVTAPSDHTITVTTNEDQLNGDGVCSLREAISAANSDTPVGACPAGDGWDTIVLGAGPYVLSIPGTDEDDNATGDLDVFGHLTLRGTGATVIDADRIDRVVEVTRTTLLLDGVVATDGHAPQYGGCIENTEGFLLMVDSVAAKCESVSYGGGVFGNVGITRLVGSAVRQNLSSSECGGLYNSYGVLSVQDSSIVTNTGESYGGGLMSYLGTSRISASEIASNTVNSRFNGGGGINFDYGALLIDGGTDIHLNYSVENGGGIHADSGAMLILDSSISHNQTEDQGGGIHTKCGMWLRNTVVEHNTAEEEGGGIHGGGYIQGSTIRHNESLNNGGGLHSWAVLERSEISNNAAPSGGGIFATGVVLLLTSVHDNSALAGNGGGLHTGSGDEDGGLLIVASTIRDNTAPAGQMGAGIFAELEPVTMGRSTVSGNTGADGGGGIYVQESTVHLLNSTVSGNSAGAGGGIAVKDGSLSLNYSTVADNSATASAGGILNANATTLENSIVAGNKAGNGATTDCEAGDPFTFGGFSLFGSGTGCSAVGRMDQTVDPASVYVSVLGPLAKNGGPATGDGQETSTHALLPSSPALDTADGSLCPDMDQRGVSRPQGAGCDVGAYEGARQLLEVTIAGSGSGTVSSAPAGIDCSSGTCQAIYDFGTGVTLSATPDSDSVFAGWSGDCTNVTGDCVLMMDAARRVTATFHSLGVYLPYVNKNNP